MSIVSLELVLSTQQELQVVQVQPTKTPGLLLLSKLPMPRPQCQCVEYAALDASKPRFSSHTYPILILSYPLLSTPSQSFSWSELAIGLADKSLARNRRKGAVSPPRFVVLKTGGVGKSVLTCRFVKDVFVDGYNPVIEEEYIRVFNLQVLDIAGVCSPGVPSPNSSPEKAVTDETVSTSTPVHPKPVPVTLPKASTPTTLLNPSGCLAKCRNRAFIPFPPSVSAPSLVAKDGKRSQSPSAKARPVALPVKSDQNSLPISRSSPVVSHIPRRNERRNVIDVFLICDDNDNGFECPSTFLPIGRKGVPMRWQQMSGWLGHLRSRSADPTLPHSALSPARRSTISFCQFFRLSTQCSLWCHV
ncbi:hypothetical protein DFH11DRAFT_1776218 [Phellopilus nigrolimitatus]|nr:hypothetical protein DFH11DRAFT_1776218 [Phellopilus nigrolimitatus]